jgi:murein DD-endopeptidase MepM/ murein hydrolase activator NlpD
LGGNLVNRSNAQGNQQLSANSLQSNSEGRSSTGRLAAASLDLPDLPALPPALALPSMPAISRRSDLRTIIPSRSEETVKTYTVDKGDSVFEIAARFNLKPESVLWANYVQLNDNPDMISLGMELNIPPVDGVLHVWKEGESIEAVAGAYQADPEAILSWPGNEIDLTTNVIQPGALVMVPGGKREYRQWIIPTIPRGRAGVSQSLYGGGACEGGYDGAYGSGAFIWPAGNHVLSGNDYWDGHLGIDIAAGEGAPVYAADSGVVVFAGWATGGYGNMVMIDHGNGYQTVYAHMSSVRANCGQSVAQGGTIGFSGNTGNSTGAHLHFEVRYQGGFVSPWYVLPAP